MTRHDKGPPERERPAATPDSEPIQKSAKAPSQHDQHDSSSPQRRHEGVQPAPRQIPAVGPLPDVGVLLVNSLLWCRPDDADEVLRLVRDDDVASPHLGAILAAIRELLSAGQQISPQLVLDRLIQAGVHRPVHAALIQAATAGGCPEAVRDYAAAVVAQSLRRRVESGGVAMWSAADDLSEAELPVLVGNIAATISAIAVRLATLRGEVTA
jgi:hypothetical protein